jgi:hypothetical protein
LTKAITLDYEESALVVVAGSVVDGVIVTGLLGHKLRNVAADPEFVLDRGTILRPRSVP